MACRLLYRALQHDCWVHVGPNTQRCWYGWARFAVHGQLYGVLAGA
jgi:hypothetical protein